MVNFIKIIMKLHFFKVEWTWACIQRSIFFKVSTFSLKFFIIINFFIHFILKFNDI